MNALDVRGAAKRLGGTWILPPTDLQVAVGECVALVGPNGSGKTTLVRMCAGLSLPTKGAVSVFGEPPSTPRVRKRIGTVLHEPGLASHLTVREQLQLWQDIHGWTQDTTAYCKEHGLPPDGICGRLSRGQRQRLNIALALAGKPDLLLLDEPFAGLDGGSHAHLERRIQDRGDMAVLVVLHDRAQAERLADRVVTLSGGVA